MADRGIVSREIIGNDAIGPSEVGTDAVGNGLTGGGGSAVAVNPAATDDGAAVIAAAGGVSVNADRLNIDETFANITPDIGSGIPADGKDLSAILKGFDNAIGAVGGGGTLTNVPLAITEDGQTVFDVGQETAGPRFARVNNVRYAEADGYFTMSTTTFPNDTLTWANEGVIGELLQKDNFSIEFYV